MSNVSVRLGGLWEGKDKRGRTYLSGGLGGGVLHIFKNDYKEKDTDPDYEIRLSPRMKREQTEGGLDAHTEGSTETERSDS